MLYSRGITFIELLLTVVLIAVVAALATPSMLSFIQRNSVLAVSSDLVADLRYARSEAIRRNAAVTLCASSDQQNCAGDSAWENGWIVNVDLNENDTMVLRVRDLAESTATITTAGDIEDTLTFNGRGEVVVNGATFSSGAFTVCEGGNADAAARLVVGPSGSVHTSQRGEAC